MIIKNERAATPGVAISGIVVVVVIVGGIAVLTAWRFRRHDDGASDGESIGEMERIGAECHVDGPS